MKLYSAALLAIVLAMVAAVPLTLDAYAQTTGSLSDIVSKAETATSGTAPNIVNTDVVLTFRTAVNWDRLEKGDFAVDGKTVSAIPGEQNTGTTTTVTLRLASTDAFASDARPEVSITRTGSFTSGSGLNLVTYNTGSVTPDDKIKPKVTTCTTSTTDPCGAKITGPREITIIYDEPVRATISDYVNLLISKHSNTGAASGTDVDQPRNLVSPSGSSDGSVTGSGTDTHTLTFVGNPSSTSSKGKINLLSGITDLAGNKIVPITSPPLELGDGQDPEILRAIVGSLNSVYLYVSEPIRETDGTTDLAAGSFTNIRLGDATKLPGAGTVMNITECTAGEPRSLVATAAVDAKQPNFPDTSSAEDGTQVYRLPIRETGSTTSNVCLGFQSSGIMTINAVEDLAGNEIPKTPNLAVTDGQPPSLDAPGSYAKITGPNQFTIKANEPLLAPEGTFKFKIGGQERAITSISGTSTDTLVVEFAGRALNTAAEATGSDNGVFIGTTLTDLSGNPESNLYKIPTAPSGVTKSTVHVAIKTELVDDAIQRDLADGQPPRQSGPGEVKEPNLLILRFSEAINKAMTGENRFWVGNNSTAAPNGTVQVQGASARSIVLPGFDPSDGCYPKSPAPNFSPENINTEGICIVTNQVYIKFGNQTANPTTPNPLLAGPNDTVSLVIANMADDDGNRAQNVVAVPAAKQIPSINDAGILNATTIRLVFDEPVVPKAGTSAANWKESFYNLRLSSQDGVSRTVMAAAPTTDVAYFNFDRSRIIDVRFTEADDPISTDETAKIGVRNLKDLSNPGPVRDFVNVAERSIVDRQPPVVTSAKITGPNQMSIEFSEAVKAKKSDFRKVMIGTGLNAERTVKDFMMSSDFKTVTFTFSGDEAADDAKGSVHIRAHDGVADTSSQSNKLRLAPAPAPGEGDRACTMYHMANFTRYNISNPATHVQRQNVLDEGGRSDIQFISCTVSDGQKPMLESLAITGPNEITADFTEPVKQGKRDGGVADGFTGFKIGENDRRNTTIKDSAVRAGTAADDSIILTFGGSPAELTDSGTITITGDLEDASGNKFDPLRNQEVKAGQVPYIKSAKFTGPNQVTVDFSEGVSLPRGAGHFENLRVAGESSDRTVSSASIMDQGMKINLKFSGDEVPTGATGRMAVSGATDGVSNVMAAAPNTRIEDGQRPTAMPKVTGPNQVTVTFSEPVTATASDFGEVRFDEKMELNLGTKAATDPRIISNWTMVSPTVYTMTFSGEMVMTNGAAADDTGFIKISGDVVDASKNNFMPTDTTNGEKITDGQKPILYRAEIGDGKYVQIVYSEPTIAPRGSYFNLNFAGDVKELIDRPHSGDRHHLNYTDEPATAKTGTLSVGTAIADPAGNKVVTTGTIEVSAKAKPNVVSARITHDNEITVTFSEPVKNTTPNRFDVNVEGSLARQPTSTSGEYTNTIKLTFADNSFTAGATGTLRINPGSPSSPSIVDLVDSGLTGETSSIPILPLQSGTTRSALITGPNEITITFNERVLATDANFENLEVIISGEKQGRSIDKVTGSGNAAIMITFGGDAVPSDATAEIDIVRVTNTNGETYEALRDVSIGDGQAPTLDPVMISSSNEDMTRAILDDTVTVRFTASEPIRTPTVTINEEAAPVRGDGNMWNATRTLTAADLARESKMVQFTIDYMDTMRNAGMQVTGTTDDSSVTMGAALATISGKVCVTTADDGLCNAGDQGYISDPPYNMYLVPPANSGLMWDGMPHRTAPVNQETGVYTFDNVTPGMEWVVQTTYFPRDLTVKDDATSWYTRVTPTEGQEFTFDVAFYRVPQSERNTLDLRTYHDINRNGLRDAGEDGIPGLTFRPFTYVSGTYDDLVTGANGAVVKNDMMRGDWVILAYPDGWEASSIVYQRTDPTSGKKFNSGVPLVDDPEPNSIHTITFGLVRTS